MAPPELPRDAPVADVVHPLEVGLAPIGGNKNDAARFHGFDGLFGQRLGLDEPLRGDQRLDNGATARALADIQRVVFGLHQRAQRTKIGQHLLAGFETIQPRVLTAGGGNDAVFADHLNLGQVVAATGLEIVGVVRGRDLHHTGTELGIGEIVEDHRNLAVHQGQVDGAAVQVAVALVGRIDRHGGIAEHGFRPRGGHRDEAAVKAVHRVTQVPHVALHVGVGHFQVGERGAAARAAVDHVLAAVDEAFFVEAHENFAHGAREARIEREALARPIAACAHADHLPLDVVAVLGLPFPNALLEGFAAQVLAANALFGQFAFDDHLGGDAGVVGARQPERVLAQHAVPADGDIDFGVLQHVTDVEGAGHVGRRNNEGKRARGGRSGSAKDAGIDPPLRPMRLEPLGLVHLFNLHGNVLI